MKFKKLEKRKEKGLVKDNSIVPNFNKYNHMKLKIKCPECGNDKAMIKNGKMILKCVKCKKELGILKFKEEENE